MKVALPCTVSKTAVHLLGSRVPKRPQNRLHCRSTLSQRRSPTARPHPKKALLRRSHRQIPNNRNCFPLLLDTNLKGELRLVQPRIVRRLTA